MLRGELLLLLLLLLSLFVAVRDHAVPQAPDVDSYVEGLVRASPVVSNMWG